MARADYIYIAFLSELPVAAFTVKFELYQWLKQQTPALQDMMVLMRVMDGKPGEGNRVGSATALIKQYEKPQQASEQGNESIK